MDLYFAGYGFGGSCDGLYSLGLNLLATYHSANYRARADHFIFNLKWDKLMSDFSEYLKGVEKDPVDLLKQFNSILDSMDHDGPRGSEVSNNIIRGNGMDLYLVGPEKKLVMDCVTGEKIKSNLLFSYLSAKSVIDEYKQRVKPKKLFVDSGAFTAWTTGKEVDADAYIDWINERAEYIDLYGQVDAIPGDHMSGHYSKEQVQEAAEATWNNYLYMRPKMKRPEGLLYTFHVGEDFEYLRRALEWRDPDGKPIPYIALGGMVRKPTAIRKLFLDGVFNTIKKSSNPNVKTHAFGMTAINLLEKYPITSADSTTWIMVGSNGGIMTDIGVVSVSDQMAKLKTHYSHLDKKHQEEFEKSISEFGFTLDELRRDDPTRPNPFREKARDNRIIFNALYMNKKISQIQYNPGPNRRPLF